MFPPGYYQTAPSTDLFPGPSSWGTTADGPQNLMDFAENEEAEEYTFYGQVTPRADSQDYDLKAEATSTTGETICRQPSSTSHKNRTIKASISKSRPRLAALHTSQMPTYEVTGNSQVFQDATARSMVPFAEPEPQMLYPASLSLGMSDVPPLGLVDPSEGRLDHQFDALFVGSPEASWDSFSSAGNSPNGDDVWTAPASSPRESNTSSPEIQGQSRITRKVVSGSVMQVADGVQRNVIGGTVPDDASVSATFGGRRVSSEGERARVDPLYKNAYPNLADGLYHCPFEGTSGCNHKPEKLKCNYDKFVDSHLKPYRCKVESCENARFSSTACLLRHEREAHAMHGHGDKPYLCTYEGCDRSIPGNGFPRQWNLKDHMRRVHNNNVSRGTTPPSASSKSSSSKGRKRKGGSESSSSRKATFKATSDNSGSRRSKSPAAKQPLIKEWYEHYVVLKEGVNGMAHPDSMETLNAIKNVQERLGRLSTISHNLVYSQRSHRSTQQSG